MDYVDYSLDNEENIVKITIFGVGGGGCNAVNRLIEANVKGVSYIASNTDMAALSRAKADIKIQLGVKRTKGHGAGSRPQVGKEAAEESKEAIINAIKDTNLLFITAGMGGGTGTGAAPVVASIAKELGIVTIAIVTKPFAHEGNLKMRYAEAGIEELRKYADVLLIIPNQKVQDFVREQSKDRKEDGAMLRLMQVADDVLHSSIVGITDLVVKHSVINLDFADLCTVIKGKGTAHIGLGQAEGENRVMNAIIQAANSPLLESNFEGATQIIVSITGDVRMNAAEIGDAMNMIYKVVNPECNIIQGLGFDENLEDKVFVTIVATGFDENDTTEPLINIEEVTKKEEPVDNFANIAFNRPVAQNNEGKVESDHVINAQPVSNDQADASAPAWLRRLRERGNK